MQPLLESYYVLENIFTKVQTDIKDKQSNSYKFLNIRYFALGLVILAIYKYSKKIVNASQKPRSWGALSN